LLAFDGELGFVLDSKHDSTKKKKVIKGNYCAYLNALILGVESAVIGAEHVVMVNDYGDLWKVVEFF
jgi:hypothetical protein